MRKLTTIHGSQLEAIFSTFVYKSDGFERMIDLIYCAGGNRKFAEIAIAHGFKYGAQLPATTYENEIGARLYFADQDFKAPNRDAYMRALATKLPAMATVLDWARPDQLDTVLDWAQEASQYADYVIIVPKVQRGISRLPKSKMIGGKQIVLGYSLPTSYGGTAVPLWEFAGWPVHILGGSPHAQMRVYVRLRGRCPRITADGNYAQLMAVRYCQFYDPSRSVCNASNKLWPTLKAAEGERWEADAPYEAFRRSCIAIMEVWHANDRPYALFD